MNEEQKNDRAGVCLSRHVGQKILLNNGEIIVKVTAVRGNRIYVYVEAPRRIRIQRPAKEEDRLDRENAKAFGQDGVEYRKA
jgi:sRNA-binding carbon storage regulator CsrA